MMASSMANECGREAEVRRRGRERMSEGKLGEAFLCPATHDDKAVGNSGRWHPAVAVV
jgi:hypothetical protein